MSPQPHLTAPALADQLPVTNLPAPELAVSGLAGSGLAGSGLAGSGLAGSGLAGSGLTGAPRVWVVGVHGGAGETTIARLIEGAAAAGHRWPATGPVLLVCRSSGAGLAAAQHAGTQWAAGAAGTGELVGLLVIADAPGRLPKPLAQLIDLVAGGVLRVWRWPWLDRLRTHPDLDHLAVPRSARRVLAEIDHHLQSSPSPSPVVERTTL